MTEQQAVQRGFTACADRGMNCRVQNVHLTGNGVWKVKMRAHGGNQKGHIQMDFDRHTHELLRYDAKVRPWRGRHQPRFDYDRDWDDDYYGDDRPPQGSSNPPGHGASNPPGHGTSNPPGHGASSPDRDDKKDKKDKKDRDDDDDDDDDDDRRPRNR